MAFPKQDGKEDAQECPVCYESLSGAERTLSCGHVFCHDCLVKTLVTINCDGIVRDTIVCPVCRHLTFIKKQKEALQLDKRAGGRHDAQTLEVPLSLAALEPESARRLHGQTPPDEGRTWAGSCLRGVWERVRRQRLISPGHNASQIFIISAEGRPMAEGDALTVVMSDAQPQRRRRRRVCTTARCLFVLLSAFTLLALVAATLPWILLA